MGFVKREYSLFDYDFNVTTRTPRETLDYFPSIKSKSVGMILMEYAFKEVESTFSKRKELNHNLIIEKLCNLMGNYCRTIAKPGDLDFTYIPNVCGGRHYNFNCMCVDGNNTFEFDTIQIGIGVVFRGHHSNIIRTILINPTQQVKDNYNFLQLIQRVIIYNLRDGVDLHKIYESIISFARNENQYLEPHLENIFGCLMDPDLIYDFVICPNARTTAQYGMVFVININLMGLEEGGKCYSLRLVNTVLVKKGEPAELLTNILQTEDDVMFYMNEQSGLVDSS